MQSKFCRDDKLKKCEDALPRLKEGDLDKVVHSKNRSGM